LTVNSHTPSELSYQIGYKVGICRELLAAQHKDTQLRHSWPRKIVAGNSNEKGVSLAGALDRVSHSKSRKSPMRLQLVMMLSNIARADKAEAFARAKGWRPSGRAAWLKADGTTVYFISLEAQLAAVPAGTKIHRCR
jgi:hypothetical protein